MNIILFEDAEFAQLFPLTLTKPASELRIGILTIEEKWDKWLPQANVSSWVDRQYLQSKHSAELASVNLYINNRVMPHSSLIAMLETLEPGQGIKNIEDQVVAFCTKDGFDSVQTDTFTWQSTNVDQINYPEDIFSQNGEQLSSDFKLLTNGRKSAAISATNQCINSENIFLEEGAKVECAILNASNGPIYVGKNAEIMEGSIVRGALAMGEGSVLKLGAKIYGPTTIGPFSKVGGEVNNSVIQGYSNKGHDGFLGNSVIGEWCNIGADSNTSNLKNNYAPVKLWDYTSGRFRQTGKQFCGLIMGDHSKCGINTMFNTGTVVGVCCNIYGSGFPRNFVPSFAWGGASGFTTYRTNKVFEVAQVVMARRNVDLSEDDKAILQAVYDMSENERFWENKK